MSKAWLITHPETKLDKEGRIHGKLDPPLSDSGRQRADSIGRSLKGKGINRIHSSPRKRALETAHAISKHTGAQVHVSDRLEPWDLSTMSGAKTASIGPLLDFFSKRPNRSVPGGESKQAVLDRYKRFIGGLRGGDAVVAHSQHSLAWDHVTKGGDASKVPMIGGKAGEVKEVSL